MKSGALMQSADGSSCLAGILSASMDVQYSDSEILTLLSYLKRRPIPTMNTFGNQYYQGGEWRTQAFDACTSHSLGKLYFLTPKDIGRCSSVETWSDVMRIADRRGHGAPAGRLEHLRSFSVSKALIYTLYEA